MAHFKLHGKNSKKVKKISKKINRKVNKLITLRDQVTPLVEEIESLRAELWEVANQDPRIDTSKYLYTYDPSTDEVSLRGKLPTGEELSGMVH